MASPEVWGPKLWFLLHTLADYSDRRDIYPLWKNILISTIATIPCKKCQTHMQSYWNGTPFLVKSWDRLTGLQTRDVIRNKFHMFHNAVNARLEKPVFELPDPLPPERRVEFLDQIHKILSEDFSSWSTAWKNHIILLLRILRGGSN
jgi:hypothetical protein